MNMPGPGAPVAAPVGGCGCALGGKDPGPDSAPAALVTVLAVAGLLLRAAGRASPRRPLRPGAGSSLMT